MDHRVSSVSFDETAVRPDSRVSDRAVPRHHTPEAVEEVQWCMLDCGVTSEQGTRRTMEDQHTMLPLAEGIPFFGVYDGHGGKQCAEYLKENLHKVVLAHPKIKSDPELALKESIERVDAEFLTMSAEQDIEAGCVLAVAVLVNNELVVANVGDTEIILSRGGEPLVLTVKHNPQKSPEEAERIKAAGGRLMHNRVCHPRFNPIVCSLAVSRAIGDAGFKLEKFTGGNSSGVIATPHTRRVPLTAADEFLVIGCDGLWDVMGYDEVILFSQRCLKQGATPDDITNQLVEAALSKGSTDNVTVAFVLIQKKEGQMRPASAASSVRGNLGSAKCSFVKPKDPS